MTVRATQYDRRSSFCSASTPQRLLTKGLIVFTGGRNITHIAIASLHALDRELTAKAAYNGRYSLAQRDLPGQDEPRWAGERGRWGCNGWPALHCRCWC